MDPAWAAILVGIGSSLITAAIMGAINFAALKAWMARREVHEAHMQKDVADHETRLRELERMDYAR